MACIPADSKAFIKPFEGTDVTCLVIDVVAYFGADEINSILNTNSCNSLKLIPNNQKALWRDIEPQVCSEKVFLTALGVRLLITKLQHVDVVPPPSPYPSFYNNTQLNQPSTSTVCYNYPRFDLSKSLHNLGNIFINEAIYDLRAYPELENINNKLNSINDLLINKEPAPVIT